MSGSPFKTATSATTGFSVLTAVTLVVFVLGVFGLLLIHAKGLTGYFKESVQVQVFFNDESEEAEVLRVKKLMETRPFIKSAEMVKREEAAAEMERELGEEFVEFLGFNPIPNSLDLRVKADYASNDSLMWIEKEIASEAAVREVVYQKVLVERIDKLMNRSAMALLIFMLLLLTVAVALINNTIRLAIYSKRFLIKSMQLVGATPGFIRRPFVVSGMMRGLLAGVIAVTMLVPMISLANNAFPDLRSLQDPLTLGALAAAMILFSVVFSGLSTFLAISRYLRLKQEQLY
jgi:cell division transport system permease protein